jgi:hypothetical protein
MNLLIGSRALAYWDKDFPIKANADWDVISESPIKGTEWHEPYFLNNVEVKLYASNHHINFNGATLTVVSPKGLALIKRSHLWRKLGFGKHITHYHKHLAKYAKQLTVEDVRFLEERTAKTREAFPQIHPKLNVSKEDFFDDYVTKKYDHDYLHELVAFYQRPLYKELQVDPNSAWCDKRLWFTLPESLRDRCVAEEAYVIAIERFLVPNNWDFPFQLAYLKALEKICTTLCSGWFRDHAIDSYPYILELFNENRILQVKEKLCQI